MGSVRETLALEHRVDVVWELFCDPDRWLAWNTELAGMRDVRGPFDHVGAGYTQVWRVGPWEREGSWEVTGCEPGRWRTVSGRTPIGLEFSAREEFASTTRGTQATVEIAWRTPGGRVGRWFDQLVGERVLRRALRTNGERIRAVLAQAG